MGILSFFRSSSKSSASVAKERLQIVVAHQRRENQRPDYFLSLQRDLLEVVRRYVTVSDDAVKVEVDHQGDCDILELNIVLPDR
ncbi:MAG: cell division topological specificity factor MinE [Candidatus Macondimonas sp.]|jgi:cell division topological specificity factor|nr:cell division topological specificity factor MinE [Candidatus Macondimonas sp.]